MKQLIILFCFSITISLSQESDSNYLLDNFDSGKNFKYTYNDLYSNLRENKNDENILITWKVKFKVAKPIKNENFTDTIMVFVLVRTFDYYKISDSLDRIGKNGYKICEDSIRNNIASAIKSNSDKIMLLKNDNKHFIYIRGNLYSIRLRTRLIDRNKKQNTIEQETYSFVKNTIPSFEVIRESLVYKYYDIEIIGLRH